MRCRAHRGNHLEPENRAEAQEEQGRGKGARQLQRAAETETEQQAERRALCPTHVSLSDGGQRDSLSLSAKLMTRIHRCFPAPGPMLRGLRAPTHLTISACPHAGWDQRGW